MRVYRKSSLIEDLRDIMLMTGNSSTFLGQMLDKIDETKSIPKKGAAAADALLDTLNRYPAGWITAQTKIAQLYVEKLVEGLVSAAWDATAKKFFDLISVEEILSILFGDQKDVLSLKYTWFSTDRSSKVYSEDEVRRRRIYKSTVSGYADAVDTYQFAPRATQATHLAMYAPLPVGVLRFIAESLEEIWELSKDPLFAEIGLGNMFQGQTWKTLYARLKDEARKATFNVLGKPGLSLGTVSIEKSNRFIVDAQIKKSENPMDGYTWYLNIPIKSGLVNSLNVSRDKEYAIRLRTQNAKGVDTSELAAVSKINTALYRVRVVQEKVVGMGGGVTDTVATGQRPPLIILEGPVRPTAVKFTVTPLGENSITETFKNLLSPEKMHYAELWEVSIDGERTQLLRLVDATPLTLRPDIAKEDAYAWYGISLDSFFPSASGWVDTLKQRLLEILRAMLKTADLAVGALQSILDMLLSIIDRAISIMHKICKLAYKILHTICYADIRYILFYGSFPDLKTAWKMIRSDYGLVEDLGFYFPTIVATVKPEFVAKFTNNMADAKTKALAVNKKILKSTTEADPLEESIKKTLAQQELPTVFEAGQLVLAPAGLPTYNTDLSPEENVEEGIPSTLVVEGTGISARIDIPTYKESPKEARRQEQI